MSRRRYINRRRIIKKRYFFVLFLCLLLLGIGYSNLGTLLNINGEVSVSKHEPISEISLDNQSATTSGTENIYEKYGDGFYLDSDLQHKMSTYTKFISVPTKTDYGFDGYYTEPNGNGVQYIDSNGRITDNVDNTHFFHAGTLYAKWGPPRENIILTMDEISDIYVGDSLSVSVYVGNSGFSGSVVLTNDDLNMVEIASVDSNGLASFTINYDPYIPYGTYTFNAIAIPDDGTLYNASPVVSDSVFVDKREAFLTAQGSDIKEGKTETINVSIGPDGVTGTVWTEYEGVVYSGEIIQEVGKAQIKIDGLAPDKYTLEIRYSGDDKYHELSGYTVHFTVTKSTS